VHVIDDREHVQTVAAQVKHLQVRLDLILGLFSQGHLLLHTLAECRKLVVVIVVSLLPKHAQETFFAFFSFLFPILGVDSFEALLGDTVG